MDRYLQFVRDFAEGPGRAYCHTHGFWWHLNDGYWTKWGAGTLLTNSLHRFAAVWADEMYPGDLSLRQSLVTNQVNAIKRRLQGYLAREGLPGLPNVPVYPATGPHPPSSEPPAPPDPAEPAAPPESGPPAAPVTAEPAA